MGRTHARTERVRVTLATKRRKGYAPRTLNRHLNLLSELLNAALKRELVRSSVASNDFAMGLDATAYFRRERRYFNEISPLE